MTDPTSFLEFLLAGKYLPAIGLALIAFVAAFRKVAATWFPWFATKAGGYTLGLGSAFTLYLAAALRDGAGITAGLLANALAAGWAASGGWETLRDLLLAAKKKGTGASSGAALAIIVIAAGASAPLLSGCGAAKESLGRVAGGVIDCMAPAAKDAIGAFAPAFRDVVRNATSDDGRVDWAPVKAAASSLRSPAQRCVLAAVIAEVLRPRAKTDVQASALEADPASVSAGFEELRASWGGPSFALEGGTL